MAVEKSVFLGLSATLVTLKLPFSVCSDATVIVFAFTSALMSLLKAHNHNQQADVRMWTPALLELMLFLFSQR